MSMKFGTADVHLIGKIMDAMDDEMIAGLGLTTAERRRADWIFDDVDNYLNEEVDWEWNDLEVE